MELNRTHDAGARSWVESASGGDFPVQNLPFGVFSVGARGRRRVGVAIGDEVLDVTACLLAGLFEGDAKVAAAACGSGRLNELMGMPSEGRWRYPSALRHAIFDLLTGARRDAVAACLVRRAEVTMHLPATVGDYTDFYASIDHARRVGEIFRPENPLPPSYLHMPIGYHGRASSVVVSGSDVRRPLGQMRGEDGPVFGPTKALDYELELGFWVGEGQTLGSAIDIAEAETHLFGVTLLNDWSARDIQSWEYVPLGPFLGKNFATTVSPWVVTMEALLPFRCAARRQEIEVLPYLRGGGAGFDIAMSVEMRTAEGGSVELSKGNFSGMYWTAAQMVAHHTVGGCNLRAGDLIGSGTVSGPESMGCLLEMTRAGKDAQRLANGEVRTYLLDGDEVRMSARCERKGFVGIGFGECLGRVLGAR